MDMRRVALPVVVVLAAAVAGCGSSNKSSSNSSTAQQPSAPKLGVTFTKPTPREKVGSTVTATVHVTNFKLDPKAVGKPAAARSRAPALLDGRREVRLPEVLRRKRRAREEAG